jgi:hypothetical protein
MKITSLLKLTLLTGSLVLATNSCLKAQDTGGSSSGGGHHDSGLTSDERAELKADRDKVFDANPDLKKEGDDLKSQRPQSDASADDKAAFHDKWHAFMDKVNDAIEKIDPNAAPIIAKMQAARHAKDSSSSQ